MHIKQREFEKHPTEREKKKDKQIRTGNQILNIKGISITFLFNLLCATLDH